MVIITAVYVVATILICIFNGKSAAAAKGQIEEMIRQYNESHRPVVIVSFDTIRNGLLCLILENIGPVVAKDVKIKINDEFLDNLDKKSDLHHLRGAIEATLLLTSHQKEYIPLGGPTVFNEIASVPAKIDISYNDKYEEHLEIDLMQSQHMLLYNSELGDISEHIKYIENEAKSFHNKLVEAISKRGPVSVLLHTADESKKFETYKAVCLNPGSTTERLGEIVELPKEDALNILIELDRVDRFVQVVPCGDDVFHARWYRR